jgi:hypothetical protein
MTPRTPNNGKTTAIPLALFRLRQQRLRQDKWRLGGHHRCRSAGAFQPSSKAATPGNQNETLPRRTLQRTARRQHFHGPTWCSQTGRSDVAPTQPLQRSGEIPADAALMGVPLRELVPRAGIEPARPFGTTDFKSVASAIPPPGPHFTHSTAWNGRRKGKGGSGSLMAVRGQEGRVRSRALVASPDPMELGKRYHHRPSTGDVDRNVRKALGPDGDKDPFMRPVTPSPLQPPHTPPSRPSRRAARERPGARPSRQGVWIPPVRPP